MSAFLFLHHRIVAVNPFACVDSTANSPSWVEGRALGENEFGVFLLLNLASSEDDFCDIAK